MAWSSVGFDGTINEAQWSALAGLLGNGYVAAGNGDCLVTAVAGARSVSVAAGSLYGDGVLSTNSAPETVAMTTPVNGQWYVIALRRTWATNTAALVAIAGATTTTTTPTAPPSSFPTLNTNTGVLTDQPIAWAWCNSANTTVVVYDIRLKAVKSLPPVVANATERDAKFMSPTQGLQVWRDDLGAVETYYGLYNASTNQGGRDTAGWYTTSRVTGLVPIKPTVVTAAGGGTATVTPLGQISFSACTDVYITIPVTGYVNHRVVFTSTASTSNDQQVTLQVTNSGVAQTGYYYTGYQAVSNGGVSVNNAANSSYIFMGYSSVNSSNSAVIDMAKLELNTGTSIISQFSGWLSGGVSHSRSLFSTAPAAINDGIRIGVSGGTITGYISIFGLND